MAGKHRKPSRRHTPRRWLPGLTAAAVSATGLSTAVMTGTTTTITVPAVKLAATVLPANSTSQIFAGSTYYGQDYAQTDPPTQVVPFLLGPQGIAAAIDQHQNDTNKVVVLSSGWGAGQTSTALALMQNDPARQNIKLVILDNNTNRAGGGFWTTYSMFAPLLLTSSQPTPSNTDVPVVDTAYEYNINSDAPTYPINVVADLNSLVAYAYGYGAQSTAPMPADALAAQPSDPQHYQYVVDTAGNVVGKDPVPGTITYVTFASDGLPLVRPLRLLPGVTSSRTPCSLRSPTSSTGDTRIINRSRTIQASPNRWDYCRRQAKPPPRSAACRPRYRPVCTTALPALRRTSPRRLTS
jgi:hypothetical protein